MLGCHNSLIYLKSGLEGQEVKYAKLFQQVSLISSSIKVFANLSTSLIENNISTIVSYTLINRNSSFLYSFFNWNDPYVFKFEIL